MGKFWIFSPSHVNAHFVAKGYQFQLFYTRWVLIRSEDKKDKKEVQRLILQCLIFEHRSVGSREKPYSGESKVNLTKIQGFI